MIRTKAKADDLHDYASSLSVEYVHPLIAKQDSRKAIAIAIVYALAVATLCVAAFWAAHG